MSTEAEPEQIPVPLEENSNDIINILLVGETGVGKSTFINAFANYVTYMYFSNVNKDNLHILIPTTFSITDKNNIVHKINVGCKSDDDNEFLETGASATQGIKSYVFQTHGGRCKVRLIDTPGTGDTKGVQQDEINCQNIVGYIKRLGKLNGICFMFKPNQSRLTAHFEYCIWQILSRLDRAACKNIVYIFTNTSASGFHPGDTLTLLAKILQDIRNLNDNADDAESEDNIVRNVNIEQDDLSIDLERNVFCFDNECFKYLAALKMKNVEFDDVARERYRKSWEASAKACWSLIKYVNNHPQNKLTPYIPNNLMAVNMARNVITKLAPTLHELTQLLQSSTTALEYMRQTRDDLINECQQLKSKLKLVTDVEKIKLSQPAMVCASIKCSKVYNNGTEKKWHYPTICHRDCLEIGHVDYEVIGNPALSKCSVIDPLTRQCLECQCDFSLHMIIDYETKLIDTYEKDGVNDKLIQEKDEQVKEYMNKIQMVNMKNKQLTSEKKSIMGLCIQLVMFLKKYALTLMNPSFKEYILYTINLKKLSHDTNNDDDELRNLQRLLGAYEETKKLFDEVAKTNVNITWDTRDAEGYIQQRIRNLFDLAMNGANIRKLFEQQSLNNIANNNDGVEEYIHTAIFRKKKANTTNNTNNNNSNVVQKKGKKVKQRSKATSSDVIQKVNDEKKSEDDDDDEDEDDSEDQEKINVVKTKAKIHPPTAKKDDRKSKNNIQQSKKKHVNNNKANKDLKELTVDELRKLLDEKMRLEKAQKKSTTTTTNNTKNKKSNFVQITTTNSPSASSSTQFDRRSPPPPYPADGANSNNFGIGPGVSHPPPYASYNNYQHQPQWGGNGAYHPNQAPSTSTTTNIGIGGTNNNKSNNNKTTDETIEIRVRIPKDQLHNQPSGGGGAPPQYPPPLPHHYPTNPYYPPQLHQQQHPGGPPPPPPGPPYQPQHHPPHSPYYPQQHAGPFPQYNAGPFHPPPYEQQQQQFHHAAPGAAASASSASSSQRRNPQPPRGGGKGAEGGNKKSASNNNTNTSSNTTTAAGKGARTQFKQQRRGKGGNNSGAKSDASSKN